MKVEIISVTPNCEEVIEIAGRTCYQSQLGNPSIIQNWIKSGHLSILEHSSVTFRISEVSRALTHQLVRHRTGKFSQKSQRYVSETAFDFSVPESIQYNDNAYEIFMETMEILRDVYGKLISMGVKKEDARAVLPNACHTEIIATFDFRNLRHFLELRLDKHAQFEIRCLANMMLSAVKLVAPNVFFDLNSEGGVTE